MSVNESNAKENFNKLQSELNSFHFRINSIGNDEQFFYIYLNIHNRYYCYEWSLIGSFFYKDEN